MPFTEHGIEHTKSSFKNILKKSSISKSAISKFYSVQQKILFCTISFMVLLYLDRLHKFTAV